MESSHGRREGREEGEGEEVRTSNGTGDWKKDLASSSIKFGFALHLTRPMLEFLCAVSDGVVWDRMYASWIHQPCNWIGTETALTRRGLLRRKPPKVLKSEFGTGSNTCELTPAGVCVVELVRMAGLFTESVNAQVKRMEREMKSQGA